MGKYAFIFPGQGSQWVGMGMDLVDRFPEAQTIFSRANQILGFDLTELCFRGPEEKLKQTQFTQPAIYVHSYTMASLLDKKGFRADFTAGHSLGELSALAHAHVYTFEDGLRLVRDRSRIMQEAGNQNPGKMAAVIGLVSRDVDLICKEAEAAGPVQPANYNSPEQIVISGSNEGVSKAMELAKAKGAKRVLELAVSGAFHSSLMSSAADRFQETLSKMAFQDPAIPVYPNVTAKSTSNAEEIKELLFRQITHPVRWVEIVQQMIQDGATCFIEVGPGKVLSGLVKRIDKSVEVIPCGTFDDISAISE